MEINGSFSKALKRQNWGNLGSSKRESDWMKEALLYHAVSAHSH